MEVETKDSDTTVELKSLKDSALSSSSSKIHRSAKKDMKSGKLNVGDSAEKDAQAKRNAYQKAKKEFADFQEIVFDECSMTVKISWEVRNVNNIGDTDVDISCLLFDKYGRWIDTCYWDNLSCEFLDKYKNRMGVCVQHGGDQVAKQAEGDEDDELDEKVEGGTEEPESIDVYMERFPDEVSTLIFALNIFTGGKTLENINHLEIQVTPKDGHGKCLHIGGAAAAYTLDSVFKLARQHSRHILWERDVTESKKSFLQNNNGLIFMKMHRDQEVLAVGVPKFFQQRQMNSTAISYDLHAPERMKNGKWKLQLLAKEFYLQTGHPIEEQIPMMISQSIVNPKVNTWELLHITVLEAVDLLAMDYNGKSDPYVALYFIQELRRGAESDSKKKGSEKKDSPKTGLTATTPKSGRVRPSMGLTSTSVAPDRNAVIKSTGNELKKKKSKKDAKGMSGINKNVGMKSFGTGKELITTYIPKYIDSTSVINSTLQPHWNHKIDIKHRDEYQNCDILRFSIFDSDYFGIFTGTPEDKWPFNAEGDIIGHVQINMSQIPPNRKLDRWFTVRGECKKASSSSQFGAASPCKVCCTCPVEELKIAGNLHLLLEKVVTPQPPLIHTIK